MGLSFFVPGDPAPEPRHRVARRRAYPSHAADAWKRAVRVAASRIVPDSGPLFDADVPLDVTITFSIERPISHYVGRRRLGPLRPDAPCWCAAKPDADNLAKAVLDALGTWPRGTRPLIYAGDQQVAVLRATKLYADADHPAGAAIIVRALEEVRSGR